LDVSALMGIFIKTFFMKALIMLCFCAFAINPLTAQNKFPFRKKATPFNNLPEHSFTFTNQRQAILIGQNTIGKIYALPTDNMPCLVAYSAKEALIPVYNTPLLHPGIPNSFPKENIIASVFINKDKLKFNTIQSEGKENLFRNFLKENKSNGSGF
jgi:hypothetical protein